MTQTRRNLISFAHGEEGSVTIFGFFFLVCMMIVGGIAMDVANAYRMRTHLQVAGDSAAHAALVVREFESAETAIAKALEVANSSLPSSRHGDVLTSNDIYFGDWDATSGTFTPDSSSRRAVLVETARLQDRGNAVGTYLLRLIGVDHWDVRRQSVFVTYKPTCLREGFVGDDIVETTSGNHYTAGFCIHSNTYVSFNNGNEFEPGVIVSMPNRDQVVLPTSGYESNPGLPQALRDGSYQLRIVNRINDIIAGVRNPLSPYYRDWIDYGSEEIELARQQKLDATAFTEGRIHTIWCNSPMQGAKLHQGTLLRKVVIVTNCLFQFGEGVALEDVTIVNSNTHPNSFDSASDLRLGRDDKCAAGGGAQLVTLGGINFPSKLEMYGGQMLAAGDVSFTSEANGIEGASIVAGGRIDGTTGSVMGFCNGDGMESNFEAWYFKLAG